MLPRGASEELQHANAPPIVTQWARVLPDWIEVWHAPRFIDPTLDVLGQGEKEAIALAEVHRIESKVLLLLDEEAARREAVARSIAVTGTLGVLKAAAAKGWINLANAFERLQDTNSASVLHCCGSC